MTPIQLRLVAVNDAFWIIAARVKPESWIPTTVVRQIKVAAIDQDDRISAQPPIARMRSDTKVNVAAFTEVSVQLEMLTGLAAVSKNGRAM